MNDYQLISQGIAFNVALFSVSNPPVIPHREKPERSIQDTAQDHLRPSSETETGNKRDAVEP